MREDAPNRRALTRRESWPRYLGGMLAETAFILALTAIAFVMALIAKSVF